VSVERGLTLDAICWNVSGCPILRGVYLHVAPGRICGLFGRNGSGKSTVLKVAAGQLRATSGLVILDGERFHTPSRRRRFARLAYLPQDSMLPDELRVSRVIRSFPRSARSLLTDDVLAEVLPLRVGELSGGRRRYLELRLILSLERDYLLLDEPFTGVDPMMIELLSELMREAARLGAGVLITDHIHRAVSRIVSDAYLIASGVCRGLDGTAALEPQLKDLGYLEEGRGERPSPPTAGLVRWSGPRPA
jgi:lipopolysaccharide export system ATP-binding protein